MVQTDNNTDAAKPIPPTAVALTINYLIPPDMRVAFADQFLLQQDSKHVYIQCFQVTPPVLAGTEDENRKTLEAMKGIDAHCVSRVVMGLDAFDKFVKAVNEIQNQLNRLI